MDAFETLSSAFVRAVPGALALGGSGGGVQFDKNKLTGGVEGLGRLVKGLLSAGWILASMRSWADDPVCFPQHRVSRRKLTTVLCGIIG
jgi:hypothetical protein